MKENDVWEVCAKYNANIKATKQKYVQPKRYFFNGSFAKTKKVTGLKALYLYYCYRLGYLPKKKPHKPLSPEMREAIRKLDRYAQQITLIYKEHLNTLDDVNVSRFATYLKNYIEQTQFIVITHRRGTMEAANILYGVTMQEKGVSKLLSLHIDDVAEDTVS